MYVCSCFGITEQQVRDHADSGACTPRQIASASKAGTDCGSCVRRIQGILGRGDCPRRTAADRGEPALATVTGTEADTAAEPPLSPAPVPEPSPVPVAVPSAPVPYAPAAHGLRTPTVSAA